MSKVKAMRNKLSAQAFTDLGFTGVITIGGVVRSRNESSMIEFRNAGVVGPNDGLTIIGSAVAGMAQAFVEDIAF
jgi:hypothetical protein